MPDIKDGMAHYNLDDPEDLAVLIDRGLIWKGGPKAIAKAMQAVESGAVPRPTRNVPDNVNRYFDSKNIPIGGGESLAVPAEPTDLDPDVVTE